MSITNLPFPSFSLLLNMDRVVIPGPSYVFKRAPLEEVVPSMVVFLLLSDIDFQVMNAKKEVNLVDLSFEDDYYVTDACYHPYYNDTISYETGSQTTADESAKKRFPFVKMRRSARFHLKNIFKRLSQLKLKDN